MWATLLLPVADLAFPLALAVPRSPSHSPSLQVSGANYAGTSKVTRARGTYPTSSVCHPPPPARYGTVRCSTAQLWLGSQGPAQPSPAVLPGRLVLSTPSYPIPQSVSPSSPSQQGLVSQVKSRQLSQPASPALAQPQPVSAVSRGAWSRSHPFLPPFSPVSPVSQSVGRIQLSPSAHQSRSRAGRTGLVPGRRVHAHCTLHTLGLPHCARPSPLPPCLLAGLLAPSFLLPAHTLHPVTYLLPSHLLPYPFCVLAV